MVTSGDFISGKKKTGEEPGKVNTMYMLRTDMRLGPF